MNLSAYRNFTRRLQESLEADRRVIGLVALGSMAETGRLPDEWSDHDFFVITVAGVQEDFRQDLSWLPDHQRIVLQVRETDHGLKVLYDDGHLLEFAVFDSEELHLARVNDYRILIDRSNLAAILAQLAQESEPAGLDTERAVGLFLSLLLVGAGRAARGEILSGHMFIKQYALAHLLSLISTFVPQEQKADLDNLDPFRRVEQAYPQIAADIHQALLFAPIAAAQALLEIAQAHLFSNLTVENQRLIPIITEYLERAEKFAQTKKTG